MPFSNLCSSERRNETRSIWTVWQDTFAISSYSPEKGASVCKEKIIIHEKSVRGLTSHLAAAEYKRVPVAGDVTVVKSTVFVQHI